MNLVITNIPGPPVPLWVGGGRLLEAYPYVEVIDGEGLTIAVVSYEDRLHFGLTADRDVMPDLDRLAHGIAQATADLAEAATRGKDLEPHAERAAVPDHLTLAATPATTHPENRRTGLGARHADPH